FFFRSHLFFTLFPISFLFFFHDFFLKLGALSVEAPLQKKTWDRHPSKTVGSRIARLSRSVSSLFSLFDFTRYHCRVHQPFFSIFCCLRSLQTISVLPGFVLLWFVMTQSQGFWPFFPCSASRLTFSGPCPESLVE
ncbi:hypothetical protein CCUS01_06888, partial [Colletotrichum cuscutae]